MMKNKSILFIIPYFGKWPEWFPFYLESCRTNSDINWLFFSDCGRPGNLPANVEIRPTSLTDYCQHVSDVLSIDFADVAPYKLCDIKPAFGLIHKEDVQRYDYFGFGDIDVIYGDIKACLDGFPDYDLISTHATRVSGHLCLMKSNEMMWSAFKKVNGWQNVMSGKNHTAFDEKLFSRVFLRRKNFPAWARNFIARFFKYQRNSCFIEQYSTPLCRIPWVDGSSNFPTEWYWNQGKLTNNGSDREFMYLHFYFWKNMAWAKEIIDQRYIGLDEFKPIETDIDHVPDELKPVGWKIKGTGFHPLDHY